MMDIELLCIIHLLSIGLSDGIELFTNSEVHRIHNCPDIMDMNFDNYTFYHAFMSGIKCAWFLIIIEYLLLIILGHNYEMTKNIIYSLSAFNIIVPLVINKYTTTDVFLGHITLYVVNFLCIIVLIFLNLLGRIKIF